MLQEQSFVGESGIARKILDEVHQIQGISRINVIIIGESGTGKEVIARNIHAGSDRAEGPFIPVNCTAIPRELAESTFFGHVRGAFSGASESHKGYFELAHDGTLFLDEIGDMPLDLQPKLLRAIEDRSVLAVGGTVPKQVDVRIIAATNQDLLKRITEGAFRRDLYFRLAQFTIEVPPLRERKEDIPLLVEHLLKLSSSEMGIQQPTLSSEALSVLESYDFPGNVRELRNIVESALLRSRGERVIGREHLHLIDPNVFRTQQPDLEAAPQIKQSSPAPRDMERIVIQRAQKSFDLESEEEKILSYAREHGSINNTECRELLSVDRRHATYLLQKLCKYGLLATEGELRWSRYVPVHDTATETASVLRAVCTVHAVVDQIAHEGDIVSFSGSFADPCVGDAHTATIDWGDGSPLDRGVVTEVNGSGIVTSTHVYRTAGRHTVTLVIADESGDAGTGTAIVDVIGTVYVDFHNPASDDIPGHGSADKPYKTIQYGIDMVLSGSTVVVAGGTPENPYIYTGPGNVNLDFGGKAITVRSSSGPAGCIIDSPETRGFYFHNSEGRNSRLEGFTIQNGNATYGGGICCDNNSSPTISNCTITGNTAKERGGGICCHNNSSLTISNCTITGNTSGDGGGGIYCTNSSPTITNCTITGNTAGWIGGGIFCSELSSPTINNCNIIGNAADESGGGIACWESSPIITSCIIAENAARGKIPHLGGGGIACYHYCSPTITNCTITGNTADWFGGGILCYSSPLAPTITNTILWNDDPQEIYLNRTSIVVSYCDVKGGEAGIVTETGATVDWQAGNIDADPMFVDAANGNYRLLDASPCKDAGTSSDAPEVDIEGHPRKWKYGGGKPNMGAYEYGNVIPESYYVAMDGSDDLNDGSESKPFRTIQKGIDMAWYGDIVLVKDGTYTGFGNVNLDFKGKEITVKSSSGNPEKCIIDCQKLAEIHGHGFYFHNGEGENSRLEGFTIQNGNANHGGGILCQRSSPTISNCIITKNAAILSGGGICCFYNSSPTITNCTITGNTENGVSVVGGGIACWNSSPIITNCTITGNNVCDGGGIRCENFSSPIITNCIIAENTARGGIQGGGGIACYHDSSPTITNCTIIGNAADEAGAGITCWDNSSLIITNTILWNDDPQEIHLNGGSIAVSYCDVKGGKAGIVKEGGATVDWQAGNIDADPLFVDAANGNYRLLDSSPCIGAGTGDGAPAEDIKENPRKTSPDMGAYENQLIKSADPVIASA